MKKRLRRLMILTQFFLLIAFFANGQNIQSDSSQIFKQKNNLVYCSHRSQYPQLAKEKKIEGTVIISCDIDSTCSIINRKVVKSLGYGCDEAALKVWTSTKDVLKNRISISANP